MLILRGRRTRPGYRRKAEKWLGTALLFGWGWVSDGRHWGRGHTRVVGDQGFVDADARVID